ncbi:TPA: hypothetical protein ACGY8I_003720 [Aeromonas hydrophila]
MLSNIKKINSKLKKQKFRTLHETKLEITTRDNGFYWIYTKLPIEKLIESAAPTNQAHVDISLMASTHKGLKYIIKQAGSDYWCIYNGKGTNLKNRISAAFTDTDGATGKLALNRVFEEDEFRIKFIVCNSSNTEYGVNDLFSSLERDVERAWRLNYGWPILCRT